MLSPRQVSCWIAVVLAGCSQPWFVGDWLHCEDAACTQVSSGVRLAADGTAQAITPHDARPAADPYCLDERVAGWPSKKWSLRAEGVVDTGMGYRLRDLGGGRAVMDGAFTPEIPSFVRVGEARVFARCKHRGDACEWAGECAGGVCERGACGVSKTGVDIRWCGTDVMNNPSETSGIAVWQNEVGQRMAAASRTPDRRPFPAGDWYTANTERSHRPRTGLRFEPDGSWSAVVEGYRELYASYREHAYCPRSVTKRGSWRVTGPGRVQIDPERAELRLVSEHEAHWIVGERQLVYERQPLSIPALCER